MCTLLKGGEGERHQGGRRHSETHVWQSSQISLIFWKWGGGGRQKRNQRYPEGPPKWMKTGHLCDDSFQSLPLATAWLGYEAKVTPPSLLVSFKRRSPQDRSHITWREMAGTSRTPNLISAASCASPCPIHWLQKHISKSCKRSAGCLPWTSLFHAVWKCQMHSPWNLRH